MCVRTSMTREEWEGKTGSSKGVTGRRRERQRETMHASHRERETRQAAEQKERERDTDRERKDVWLGKKTCIA